MMRALLEFTAKYWGRIGIRSAVAGDRNRLATAGTQTDTDDGPADATAGERTVDDGGPADAGLGSSGNVTAETIQETMDVLEASDDMLEFMYRFHREMRADMTRLDGADETEIATAFNEVSRFIQSPFAMTKK
jgi:hypothetical protein